MPAVATYDGTEFERSWAGHGVDEIMWDEGHAGGNYHTIKPTAL